MLTQVLLTLFISLLFYPPHVFAIQQALHERVEEVLAMAEPELDPHELMNRIPLRKPGKPPWLPFSKREGVEVVG